MTTLDRLVEACERAEDHLHCTYSDAMDVGCIAMNGGPCNIADELNESLAALKKERGEAVGTVYATGYGPNNRAELLVTGPNVESVSAGDALFAAPPDTVPRASVERLAAFVEHSGGYTKRSGVCRAMRKAYAESEVADACICGLSAALKECGVGDG